MNSVGILVFPGSNCDQDCARAVKNVLGIEPKMIWHKEADLGDVDAVIIPGGFSYGDYLRCGAIATHSPVMKDVVKRAQNGLPVLGICNGFQILTESGLLPGVLMRNRSLKFICKTTGIRVENQQTPFTNKTMQNKVYQFPIAHMEGNYFIEDDGLKQLEDHSQIVFRYVDTDGESTEGSNPNGSVQNIAGICNRQGNVVGLMPHPERVCEGALGGIDGVSIFESMIA